MCTFSVPLASRFLHFHLSPSAPFILVYRLHYHPSPSLRLLLLGIPPMSFLSRTFNILSPLVLTDNQLAWSPDSRFLAVGGQDDLITLFSPREARVVARCQGHSAFVTSIAFDPGRGEGRGYRFASVGEDGKLILVSLRVRVRGRMRVRVTMRVRGRRRVRVRGRVRVRAER